MKKIEIVIGAVFSVVLSCAILFVPVVFLWLIAAFDGMNLHFLVPVIGIALVSVICLIVMGFMQKKLYKKTIVALSVFILMLSFSVIAEYLYKDKFIPSITVGQQNAVYMQYMPFTHSENLSHLDGEPLLHFSKEDDLPIVDGATALFPVYCSFVEAVYPSDCKIENYVNFSTTDEAFKRLVAGDDDIIFVAQPSKEQLASANDAGVEFVLHPIGYEAFVFLVNKKNPVDSLTVQQIKDIYTGAITNWKEVGGKNKVIRPFQRNVNSGSQTAFIALMGKDAELLPPETHQVQTMMGLVDVVSDYQNHSNAIGYSFRYYVENMKRNIGVKILKLNGIEPTRENIRTQAYPVIGNFYAITVKGRESENTKKLIDWVQSRQGQELIEKVGYVSLENEG